jgi:hypothetical protein
MQPTSAHLAAARRSPLHLAARPCSPADLPPFNPHPTRSAGEHVALNMDMASVHGGCMVSLEPGDPLAVFAFMTETANLLVG